jgi:N-acetylglucosamine-6-phosphate deacetylase
MIVLSGADLILPDRIVPSGTLTIDEGRIVAIDSSSGAPGATETGILHNHTIVPGFIDVHVHGAAGIDTLDGDDAIARLASVLPRYGVTAFCPTTVACAPGDLRRVLDQVKQCRQDPEATAARVLPAHLESNFINPDFCGAQPQECLRLPATASWPATDGPAAEVFTTADLLDVIDACAPDIAIVTIAPELPGALELVSWLRDRGIRVGLGHSAASFDDAISAIDRGARHATHLFNRMRPIHHRNPGLAGAVLQNDEVVAELICDGVHVHPAVVRMALAAKKATRIVAVSDGTSVSGLEPGATGLLGGRRITAGVDCAHLDDGTMAGSILTMDVAFQRLTGEMGVSMVDAAVMCATTPARELGLFGHGVLSEGAVADLAVLDRRGDVVQTYIGGRLVYARGGVAGNSGAAGSV